MLISWRHLYWQAMFWCWLVATELMTTLLWCQCDVMVEELAKLGQHMGHSWVGNIVVGMEVSADQSGAREGGGRGSIYLKRAGHP